MAARGGSWIHWALLLVPALAVSLVALSWRLRVERASFAARVYGGVAEAPQQPVDAATAPSASASRVPEAGTLSLRVVRHSLDGAALSGQPAPLDGAQERSASVLRLFVAPSAAALPGTKEHSYEFTLNAHGVASLSLPLPSGWRGTALALSVVDPTHGVLARGELTPSELAPGQGGLLAELAAPPREEWIDGKRRGELEVAVGLEQGVLAVPFPARLLVSVRGSARPIDGARVRLVAHHGVSVSSPVSSTDERGVAAFEIVPRDHVVELSVLAELEPAATEAVPTEAVPLQRQTRVVGSWFGHLPVVAGALWSRVEGGELVVSSAVERPFAYVDWLTERGLSWSVSVPLTLDGAVWSGRAVLPTFASLPAYAITSSEPDLQSMARVAWPLSLPGDAFASRAQRQLGATLLIDGVRDTARAAAAERRRHGERALGVGLASAALEAWLVVWSLRRASRGGASSLESSRVQLWSVGALGVCMVFGLIALGVFAWLSLGG